MPGWSTGADRLFKKCADGAECAFCQAQVVVLTMKNKETSSTACRPKAMGSMSRMGRKRERERVKRLYSCGKQKTTIPILVHHHHRPTPPIKVHENHVALQPLRA